MVKKNWSNPELTNLGVEKTREACGDYEGLDGSTTYDIGLGPHGCKHYCHLCKSCRKKYVVFQICGDCKCSPAAEGEGDGGVTIPSIS